MQIPTEEIIGFTKFAAKLIAGGGASKIAGTIIRNNVDPETLAEKVQVYTGAAVIGMMVSEKVGEFTDAKLDKLEDWIESRSTDKNEYKTTRS